MTTKPEPDPLVAARKWAAQTDRLVRFLEARSFFQRVLVMDLRAWATLLALPITTVIVLVDYLFHALAVCAALPVEHGWNLLCHLVRGHRGPPESAEKQVKRWQRERARAHEEVRRLEAIQAAVGSIPEERALRIPRPPAPRREESR